MILIIDNYDSFTYNLYQYVGEILQDQSRCETGTKDDRAISLEKVIVRYNDGLTIQEIEALEPRCIILSPGPKYPKDAGICIEVVRHFASKLPILGICLGHQTIGEAFGSKIVPAKKIIHGKATPIHIACGAGVFKGLPPIIKAGRYHSLMIEKESLANELRVIAEDEEGEIMGVAHEKYPVFGIQFHPESILTPRGKEIIANFLEVNAHGTLY